MTARTTSIADRLFQAQCRGQEIPLITDEEPLDELSAYEVQRAVVERKQTELGLTKAGYKISMTSPETQRLVGASEPVYGTLTSEALLSSPAQLGLSSMNGPLIEAEVIWRFSEALSNDPTDDEITSKATPHAGIEIPDSRFTDWFPRLNLADLMCDCAAACQVVIGDPLPLEGLGPLESIEMVLYRDDAEVVRGEGSAVMGNPLNAIRWLADKLASHREGIAAGMVVSSGTFAPPVPAVVGTFRAEFAHVGSASVTFTG